MVSGGAVTLESPGAVVHIGLPITAEFETLDININGQETLLDKKQVIPSVTLVVNASRGIWATTPGGKWYEYPQREFEFYDDPVDDGVNTLFWSPVMTYSPPEVSATSEPTSIRWRISLT